MNRSNLYDMSKTCQIGSKFYEHISMGEYRVMTKICEGDERVKDKKLVARLDKIFAKYEVQDEE